MPVDPDQVAYPDLPYPDDAYPDAVPVIHPPTVKRPVAPGTRKEDRPFNRVFFDVALTVLKLGEGVYQQVEHPTDEQIEAAQAAYVGGRTYEVTVAEANALEAAGYEVSVE